MLIYLQLLQILAAVLRADRGNSAILTSVDCNCGEVRVFIHYPVFISVQECSSNSVAKSTAIVGVMPLDCGFRPSNFASLSLNILVAHLA